VQGEMPFKNTPQSNRLVAVGLRQNHDLLKIFLIFLVLTLANQKYSFTFAA